MSNEVTVRIKNKKDIKFDKNFKGLLYSKDGETLWDHEMDNLCSEVVELKKLYYAPDRWGIFFQDAHWVFRGEWFDVLSKKEIKEYYDSLHDFVGELENTSYIHSLILKEAGVL